MMKKSTVLLLLAAILALSASFGRADMTSPTEPSHSSHIMTTELSPNKTTTDTKPTTHANPTTATTEAPTTAEPTTAGPTTAGPTTAAPTTEGPTTAGPTTAAPTTHAPPPPDNTWKVKNEIGLYCILLQASISLKVSYNSTKDNMIDTAVLSVPAPKDTQVTGHCGETKQRISITFFHNWNLTFYFEKINGSKKYHLSETLLLWNLTTENITGFPDVAGKSENVKVMFETSKTGFVCTANKTLFENSTLLNAVTQISTEKLHFEAFQNKTDGVSNDYERCSEDNISNLIPIIVGACLGGLILIVLVAYLIGRKRSRRGYESV